MEYDILSHTDIVYISMSYLSLHPSIYPCMYVCTPQYIHICACLYVYRSMPMYMCNMCSMCSMCTMCDVRNMWDMCMCMQRYMYNMHMNAPYVCVYVYV